MEKGKNNPQLLIFTKYSMAEGKLTLVGNIPALKFVGRPTNYRRTGNVKGSCDPEILVEVVMTVVISVEEYLAYIGMNNRKVVVNLGCDSEEP